MEATYVSTNSFSVLSDKTDEFVLNRRLKLDCGVDGIKYSTIFSSTFTTVTTVSIDENVLTSNLVDVLYGVVKSGQEGNLPIHSHSTVEGDGGSFDFINLTNTPTTYSGTGGMYAQSTGSGIEFTDLTILQSGFDYPINAEVGDFFISELTGTIFKQISLSELRYTAKSVILDIADGWGDSQGVGVRSMDFYLSDVLIDIADVDVTCYATSVYNDPNTLAELMFITSKSKVDSYYGYSWMCVRYTNSNQRVICVFNTEITFDKIIINNSHSSGGSITKGTKNVKIYTSSDTITSTVYNEAIANSDLIFDGIFTEHTAVNEIDNQILSLEVIGSPDLFRSVLVPKNNFIELDDTPITYSGTEGMYAKSTGSGIEWDSISDVESFLGLTDTPTTYSGGQYLRTTTSGIEAIDGIILKSLDSSEWLLSVTNSGTLYTTAF